MQGQICHQIQSLTFTDYLLWAKYLNFVSLSFLNLNMGIINIYIYKYIYKTLYGFLEH
jgi:hypothetical protein